MNRLQRLILNSLTVLLLLACISTLAIWSGRWKRGPNFGDWTARGDGNSIYVVRDQIIFLESATQSDWSMPGLRVIRYPALRFEHNGRMWVNQMLKIDVPAALLLALFAAFPLIRLGRWIVLRKRRNG